MLTVTNKRQIQCQYHLFLSFCVPYDMIPGVVSTFVLYDAMILSEMFSEFWVTGKVEHLLQRD